MWHDISTRPTDDRRFVVGRWLGGTFLTVTVYVRFGQLYVAQADKPLLYPDAYTLWAETPPRQQKFVVSAQRVVTEEFTITAPDEDQARAKIPKPWEITGVQKC